MGMGISWVDDICRLFWLFAAFDGNKVMDLLSVN